MSWGLNKVMLIGHLGRDPELRHTPTGKPVVTFSLAVNRSWTSNEGERRTDTEWFNILAWGQLAEFCRQTLAKGKQVYVEGRLQSRRWEDQDGVKHTSVEVVAAEVLPLTGAREPVNDPKSAASEDEFPF